MTAPAPRPTIATDDRSVVVALDGVDVARYVHRPDDVQLESPRPYLHPMRTPGGELVSLFRPHDHVWHKGLTWSLPHVGSHNFWGGPTYVRGRGYEQLPNNGAQVHVAFTHDTPRVDDDVATLRHRLDWIPQGGDDALVVEDRTLRLGTVGDGAWALAWTSAMTNVSDRDLPLGSPTTHGRDNAGYGGLFWRGPRAWTDEPLVAPDVQGGDELRGRRVPWMGCSGRHDGTGHASTVVVVDGGDNPGGMPQWFARSAEFAALCPAPFFSDEISFGPGTTRTFRYLVVVADGPSDPDRAASLVELATTRLA